MKILIQIITISLAVIIAGCSNSEKEAKNLGFESIEEMKQLNAMGFKTKDDYWRSQLPNSGCDSIESLKHAIQEISGNCNDLVAHRKKEEQESQSQKNNSDQGDSTTLTTKNLYKMIVDVQKKQPPSSVRRDTREGEALHNAWNEQKENLIKSIKGKEISGECLYKGSIIKPEIYSTIECGPIDEQPIDQAYTLCMLKNSDAGPSVKRALCGDGPSWQKYRLYVVVDKIANNEKIYDMDKLKFRGKMDWCEIWYTDNPSKLNEAKYSCNINIENAEIMK
jgi:hypothetical protein